MASATNIVDRMIAAGVIPAEYRDVAILELHWELMRRSRRLAATLAMMASITQLGLRVAGRAA